MENLLRRQVNRNLHVLLRVLPFLLGLLLVILPRGLDAQFPNSATLHSGTGAPTSANCTLGDMYTDTSATSGTYKHLFNCVSSTYPQWQDVTVNSGVSLGGAPTDVQYYGSGGNLGGDSGFTYVATPNPTVQIGTATKIFSSAAAAGSGFAVTAGPQSAMTANWNFDWTSPTTALNSIGGFAAKTMTVTGTDLDDTLTGWKPACFLPSCNPGGVDTPASSLQQIVASPSRDGTSMQNQVVTNAITTQTNILWVNHATPTCDGCTDAYPDFWYYIPSVNCGACASSFEFDTAIFDKSEGWDFMWGTQCNQVNHLWQIENQGDLPWTNTPIACSITYDTWHHYQAHYYRIPGDLSCTSPTSQPVPCQHFDYWIFDGVTQPINMIMRAMVLNPTFNSSSIIQFQTDIGATVTAKTVNQYIDNVNLTLTGPVNYMPLAGGNFQGAVTSASTWNNLDMTADLTHNNVDLGGGLMPAAATGTQNTGIGRGVFNALSTGNSNIAAGVGALYNNTTGSSNAAYGVNALNSNIIGNSNSAFGIGSLDVTTGGSNSAFGNNSGGDNTTGTGNVFVGSGAGVNGTTPNATGVNNVIIGNNANMSVDGLSNTIVIGFNAQGTASNQVTIGNTGITSNVFHGDIVASTFNSTNMYNIPANSDLNVGGGMPLAVSGINNVAIGSGAGHQLSSGHDNVFVGLNSGNVCTTCFTSAGFGVGSLVAETTGSANTGMGKGTLAGITTGSQNTAIGLGAGTNGTTAMVTTANSTFIGVNANDSVDALTNDTVIGFNAQATISNEAVIGNTSITRLCWQGEKVCWMAGTGAPTAGNCVAGNLGSIYSNVNSAPANTLYMCTAAGVWTPLFTSITGSGTLTYTAIAANSCQEQALTVTGAVTTNVCSASPQADPGANFQYGGCRVSAANTVQVRVCSGAGGTPTAVTWNGWITK